MDPHMWRLWDRLGRVVDGRTRLFLQDAFLSIVPLAKYKDYRGKSQDLHPPAVTLKENNLVHSFREQVSKRLKGLQAYGFPPLTGVQSDEAE
ncbi:MAG TPA: hypothetical protein VGW38_11495, partial [Chloroflexota bacterium]|nr:hypothetical protein [Chloroflexota bacterium]